MEIGKRSSSVQTPAPRPAETPRPAGSVASHTNHADVQKPRRGKMLIIGLVILVLVVAGLLWFWKGMKSGLVGIDSGKYQAVFLTNGQVYFGKLSDSSDFQVKISDIYYLQVQQNVQPSDNKDSQVSLAKLGQELHGPQDTMFISKDQVLFWENLKDDGKVVQAIKANQ